MQKLNPITFIPSKTNEPIRFDSDFQTICLKSMTRRRMRSCYAIRGELSHGLESRTGIIEILPAVRDSILDNGSVKKESSSLFSSLISASIPFQQLISFLFWQFFLQPTNLSRFFFTLALTSKISSFFFFRTHDLCKRRFGLHLEQ